MMDLIFIDIAMAYTAGVVLGITSGVLFGIIMVLFRRGKSATRNFN